ncbi:hypothetical protein I7I50_02648 [Histoplasma capsulatum G186AR]|uniref:Uncharacterized protein n=1 Tax=Ajellomyces capsulatus TaxID=5037 RepID=A0A8H8D6R6_AJECA|nr:hypothetical protein I7I52_00686 [Histoplasma capsulatum]QSS71703.1 hypothetical protein I7I50_02648 [Histoplasma capsulatum G186AR]
MTAQKFHVSGLLSGQIIQISQESVTTLLTTPSLQNQDFSLGPPPKDASMHQCINDSGSV